jgi:uncharacterized membrane protein
MTYLTLKYIHIMSMLLLFGVGLGSAFYKWMADRSGDLPHIAVTNRHVVLADWMFTTPTVIIQPLTGLYLAYLMGLPLTTPWIAVSLGLYLLAGLCWLPVVWLQLRMRTLALASLANNKQLPAQYWRYADIWFWLGVPAFTAMLLIVFLMVFKNSLGG